MKELNSKEVQEVSGAGIFDGIGAMLGNAIGTIVDSGTALAGRTTDYASAGSKLGAGIAAIVSLDPISAVKQMGAGITDIIANFRKR